MKKRAWIFVFVALLAAFSFGQAEQQAQGQQGNDKASQLPPERGAGLAPKILGYDAAPGSLEDAVNYPTNTSLGYKGVLMGNFSGTGKDELLVDFGSLGVWHYNGSGAWTQVSGVNPDGMITVHDAVTPDDEAVVDFGTLGLWYWNTGQNWIQISGVNPQGMFATDDDNDGTDEIQVDFGTLGVWRCDLLTSTGAYSFAWTQISGLNPYNGLRSDVGAYGYQEGVWSFPTYGVWNIYWDTYLLQFDYTQLTGTVNPYDDHVSARFTSGSAAEDLVMDFGNLGLWLYGHNWGPWTQISTMDVGRAKEVKFSGSSTDQLLVWDNSTLYLYLGHWNGSSFTWTRIGTYDSTNYMGPGWCESYERDASGDEKVVIPKNSGGADVFDYSAGSTLTPWINTDYFINFMVKGDYYGKGRKSTLVIAFNSSSGGPGLWLYEKDAPNYGWTHISTQVPDGIY